MTGSLVRVPARQFLHSVPRRRGLPSILGCGTVEAAGALQQLRGSEGGKSKGPLRPPAQLRSSPKGGRSAGAAFCFPRYFGYTASIKTQSTTDKWLQRNNLPLILRAS